MIVLTSCNFVNGYDINTLWVNSFYITFCGQKSCVFGIHNGYLWAWDNPHAIPRHGYQIHLIGSIWAGIIRDIVVGLCLLSDFSAIPRFPGNCSAWTA
jgi:hypothetical protein